MDSNNNHFSKIKIKVCGMRDAANIAELVTLPIQYIGFIFYPQSPRFIGTAIDKKTLKLIPEHIQKVGVFVNAPLIEVSRIVSENQLQCVQLHGSEIPDYCNKLKEDGLTVIKAFKTDLETLTCKTAPYKYSCDYFLFDSPTPKHGGSGEKFDWAILKEQHISLPYFLSGGIAPGDATIIKNFDLHGLHAVDLNSRFEVEPGIKDIGRIKSFIEDIK